MSSSRLALAAIALAAIAAPVAAQSAHNPRAQLIVSTAWLSQHLKDPDLVLLHVGDTAEYRKAHIPGARYVSLRDISVSNHDHATNTGLLLELPTADSLRKQLAALGISDQSRVVVYFGNEWVSPATRVLFTLDHAGFGSHSALLDGGMNAWREAGLPLTADVSTFTPGQLSPLKTKPLVVSIDYVKSRVGSPGFHLIDARDAVYYDGVEEGSGRKGHIPGAKSLPFTQLTDDKLHLKSPAELTKLFASAGVGPADTVFAYCHIGQQATAVLLAARTLGHPVMLFDGSFQEWGRRTDLPVENPAEGTKR